MGRRAWGLAVEPGRAEEARRLLRQKGLLDTGLRVARLGGLVVFPIRDPEAAREVARLLGGRILEAEFEEYRRPGRLLGPVHGYHLIGDLAVFSRAPGVGLEEYRRLARELLEANPRVRGVWLKESTGGGFRVARLVHLAGEERTRTVAREYGLVFHVDIARAYYNPRLAYEHRRVASQVGDGELVLDMFTGVGGFAIHTASLARAEVVAVDLNPHAAMLAAENAEANSRRLRGIVHVFRADARLLPGILRPGYDRIIMNNPTMSRLFQAEACRLAAGEAWIHYYTLTTGPQEALAEAGGLEAHGCRIVEARARRVLEYSPREAVYAVDARVEKP